MGLFTPKILPQVSRILFPFQANIQRKVNICVVYSFLTHFSIVAPQGKPFYSALTAEFPDVFYCTMASGLKMYFG